MLPLMWYKAELVFMVCQLLSVYREIDSNTHADDDLPPLDIIASTPVKSQPVKSSCAAGSNGSCSVRVQAATATSAQLQSTLPVVPYDVSLCIF